MRLRVLGTTELARDNESLQVKSERQRRLLAALAMHAPRTVPADTLVDAVWVDVQPENGISALRTVVTRLRHTLETFEAGSGEKILTRPPGYALDIPGDTIDANRFADLVSLGRRLLAEGDYSAAGGALRDALGLWGGPPYAEFRYEPWAQADATRLERLWIAAREAEIETRLAAGEHAEAIGDIERLVADEPFSDSPRALLMRAAYAGGRQADALRVFHEYRSLLAEESGLEPGPELRQLEQRILENDPTLLPSPGRALRGYRIHEQLASTAQGDVYRATQPGLERDVAFEVIPAEIANAATFIRTFQTRSQALAQLGHANVVPIYDSWRDPSGAYLVSQLLTGGTLADQDAIDRLGSTGLERVRTQVRSALDVAHQSGLVHGPIEADDVQLDEHGNAYLANFRFGEARGTVQEDDESFDSLFQGLIGGPVPPRTEAPTRIGNPYRGLSVFTESDVDVFFGRSRLVQETMAILDRHGSAFVVGPSGSGKSSMVRAGVVPALAAGELHGSEEWFTVTMTPGARPFEELEAAVLRVAVHPPATLLDQLRDPKQPLARTIQRVLPDQEATTVLVIDQFEELFTLADADERDAFLHTVAAEVTDGRGRLFLVATLRADYYDEPLSHPAIANICKRSTVAVDALSGEELRAAIVEPARVVGVTVEDDLAARLVADASGHIGGLPLLQYSLTRLFEKRTGDTLSLDEYLHLGGLSAAIGARAEELYEHLDSQGRDTCRRVFGRLVAISGSSTDTRRRVRISELRSVEADAATVNNVVGPFVEARLLATDRDPLTREPTLEVAHEALFREWPRLRGWITDDRQTIATLRHLSAASESWAATGHDSELYRGARLVGALDLLEQHPDRLTSDERTFVVAARDRAEAEERSQRRQNRRLRMLLAATAVLLVVALVAGLLALREANRADDRATEAEAAADAEAAALATADLERMVALARSEDALPKTVAILLALEAHEIDPSPETLAALQLAITNTPSYQGNLGSERYGNDLTVLDDGERVVAHTLDSIEVWNVTTREREFSAPFPGATEVARPTDLHSTGSGDGALLVATAPHLTTVLDRTGAEVLALSHEPAATAVALSPDSTKLAVGREDGRVEVWAIDSPAAPTVTNQSASTVRDLAWHPDGERLVLSSTDDEVELWDLEDDEIVWTFEEPTSIVFGDDAPLVLFSNDGGRLMVSAPRQVGEANQVHLWQLDAETGEPMGEPIASNQNSNSGVHRAISWADASQSSVLASGTAGPLEIFDLTTGEVQITSDTDTFEASVGLPRIGSLLAGGSSGLDIRSLDGSGRLVTVLPFVDDQAADDPGVVIANFDPTGTTLRVTALIGAFEGIPVDWDLTGTEPTWREVPAEAAGVWNNGRLAHFDGASYTSLDPDGNPLGPPILTGSRVAFSSGTHLLALGEDGAWVLYDFRTGDEVWALEREGPQFSGEYIPKFSADGSHLVAYDESGYEVIDVQSGELVDLNIPDGLDPAYLGPSLEWFATVDGAGTISLFDTDTLEPLGAPLVGHRGPVRDFSLHPNGHWLATLGFDSTARVWDIDTGRQIGREIPVLISGSYGLSWSPDGTLLAVGHRDRGAEVWNFDTDSWPAIACEIAGRNLTPEEWEEFGPRTIERRATCPDYPL